jgi:diadenosine tetraphosphate (Ap4A) HIT family hydrolase
LTRLFKPDLFNYASLGNDTHHLHVHVIPRYASPREFQGIAFEDKRWGHSYRTNPELKIADEALFRIRDGIKKFLK